MKKGERVENFIINVKNKVINRNTQCNKILVTGTSKVNFENICELLRKNNIEKYNISKYSSADELAEYMLSSSIKENGKLLVPRVCDSLLADFFWENKDKNIWSWNSKKFLYLLDYINQLDYMTCFILVYQSPYDLLKFLIKNNKSKKEIKKELNRWKREVKKILGFFYRNKEKVLLVNEAIFYNSDMIENKEFSDTLMNYFINRLIKKDLELIDLYEELQSVANLPYFENHNKNENEYELLSEIINFRKNFLEKEKEKEIELLKQIVSNKEKEYNKKISKLEEEKKTTEEEKELLLSQLMSVQEELEKYYLENKRLKEKAEEKKRYYGAAERIKNQLSYKIGAKMIEVSKNKPYLLPVLPFILLKVRKEHKKYLKHRPKLPPIHTYADYYEAERVKKHLSYMLGETMINTLKNNPFGIFILPFKLQKTYKKFKAQKDD